MKNKDVVFSEDLNQGLSLNQWKSFELSLKNSENPSSYLSQFANRNALADKALEAGFYELASTLGPSTPLLHLKSLTFSSQKEAATQYFESLKDSAEKMMCEVFLMRTQGQSQRAYDLFHFRIESELNSFSGRGLIEARIQWASVLFNLEKWQEAINQYKLAYELSVQLGHLGSTAILAFNLATAFYSIRQKHESKTWLWVCQKELSVYQLDHLKNSVELFQIQCTLNDLEYSKTIVLAQKYLLSEGLSPLQKIRGLQALAEAQAEWGCLLDAEMTLSLAHKTIQQSQFPQYAQQQEIIENNIFSLVHRPLRHTSRKTFLNDSTKAQAQAAEARKAFKFNDMAKALRLTLELKKSSESESDFEDLFVLLSHRLEHPGKKPRTIEHQILKSWLAQQWKALEFIKIHLEIENSESPWKKVLLHLTRGLLAVIHKQESQASTEWVLAMELAHNFGLERLESLLAFMLSTLQLKKVELPYNLSLQELAFYEALLSKIKSSPRIFIKNQQGQVLLNPVDSDLIFDEDRGELTWQNQTTSLLNQPVVKRIIKMLLLNPKGISKEQLVLEVWGFQYHPLQHDSMIYSAIARLRDLLPVQMVDGHYKLPRDLTWVHLSQQRHESVSLTSRQKMILNLLENQKSLSRKEVVRQLKISERTALRELSQMVSLGYLTQSGAGRGVHYKKWNQGA